MLNTILLSSILKDTDWGFIGIVTALGFGLVFILLVALIFILKGFGWIMQPKAKVVKKAEVKDNVEHPEHEKEITLWSSTTAVIAMALHLYYNEVHDEESTKVTIEKVDRRYSPWSSKIHNMNNLHR